MVLLEHSPIVVALVLAATSVASALIALLVLSVWPRRVVADQSVLPQRSEERAVFLFDDRDLIDASAAGRRLLLAAPVRGDAWTQLVASVSPLFPGFESAMASLAERGSLTMRAAGARNLGLLAEWRSGLARITLTDDTDEGQRLTVDRLSQRAMEDELAALRATMDQAPMPIWRQDGTGAVVQANRAYLTLAAAHGQTAPATWPLPVLFDTPPTDEGRTWRAQLDLPGMTRPRWFDCHSFALGETRLHFAQPTDALVQAETSLRDFVQTLSKTFAHLPIGLAVFDRTRRLQLFNPALSDLTTLTPDFLMERPSLAAFLDRLRERHILPEPKDYGSWRQRITDLEQAAAKGQYRETWELPGGQTYRVSGRPHPEGAVAFLFEDISAEVTMTRRFRAEMALGQSVFDTINEALAVFSDQGTLAITNAAYDGMWSHGRQAADALRVWRDGCSTAPQWEMAAGRLRDALLAGRDSGGIPRQGWSTALQLRDGRQVALRLTPLPGGALLVGFSPSAAQEITTLGGSLTAPADPGREVALAEVAPVPARRVN